MLGEGEADPRIEASGGGQARTPVLGNRAVGQHEIDLVHRQLGEESVQAPFATDDARALLAQDRQLQQRTARDLGTASETPTWNGLAAPGKVFDHHLQLRALRAKELVRIFQGELSGIGEDDGSSRRPKSSVPRLSSGGRSGRSRSAA